MAARWERKQEPLENRENGKGLIKLDKITGGVRRKFLLDGTF